MSVALEVEPEFAADDPELLRRDLTSCTLLILAGQGQFQYGIFDSKSRKFLSLRAFKFPQDPDPGPGLSLLESLFDSNPVVFTNFQAVRIGFLVEKQILVPQVFYRPEFREDFLSRLYHLEPEELVFWDIIPGYDFVNVYALNRNLSGFLKKEFRQCRILAGTSSLLETLAPPLAGFPGEIFLFFHQDSLTLIVRKDGKIQLARHLSFQTETDILYQVLNIGEHLLDPEIPYCCLLGGTARILEDAYRLLEGYIRNLGWVERPAGLAPCAIFTKFPAHRFYNLLALSLCA